MLKFGYISEIDPAKGMARVFFTDDGITSSPLPVSVPASKEDKYSFPFAINEQVWCMMDDNCEFGVIGGAIYSSKDVPPGEAGEHNIIINLGATKLQLNIDKEGGNLTLKVAGDVKLDARSVEVNSQTATVKGTDVSIEAPVTTVNGALNVSGVVAAGGFSGMSGGSPGGPLTMNGAMNVSGVVTASDVVAAGKPFSVHVHMGNSGAPTSPPI